jgi:uncharacterized protein YqeY
LSGCPQSPWLCFRFLLITLIGEAERVGKDAGGRPPTDSEVTAVLLKFVKNLGEVIAVRPTDEAALTERSLLQRYLPTRLTGDALMQAVRAAARSAGLETIPGKDIGAVMKALAQAHPGAYDGAAASAAIRSLAQ